MTDFWMIFGGKSLSYFFVLFSFIFLIAHLVADILDLIARSNTPFYILLKNSYFVSFGLFGRRT